MTRQEYAAEAILIERARAVALLRKMARKLPRSASSWLGTAATRIECGDHDDVDPSGDPLRRTKGVGMIIEQIEQICREGGGS